MKYRSENGYNIEPLNCLHSLCMNCGFRFCFAVKSDVLRFRGSQLFFLPNRGKFIRQISSTRLLLKMTKNHFWKGESLECGFDLDSLNLSRIAGVMPTSLQKRWLFSPRLLIIYDQWAVLRRSGQWGHFQRVYMLQTDSWWPQRSQPLVLISPSCLLIFRLHATLQLGSEKTAGASRFDKNTHKRNCVNGENTSFVGVGAFSSEAFAKQRCIEILKRDQFKYISMHDGF